MRFRSRDRRPARQRVAAAALVAWAALTRTEPAWSQAGRPIAEAVVALPTRCIEKGALVARASELLAGNEVAPGVVVTVVEGDGQLLLVVQRNGATVGEREIELPGRECAELREAAALALAAALDGRLVSPTEPPPPSPPVAPLPPPPPAAPPFVAWPPAPAWQPPPYRAPPWTRGVSVAIAAEVGAAVAVLPEPAFAVVPALELSLTRAFDLRASAMITGVQQVDLENDAGAAEGAAEVQLAAGRLDTCLGGKSSRAVRLRVCSGLLVGGVLAEGSGIPEPRSETAPWVAAAARGDVRFELAPGFGLGLALEGLVPLVRPELVASEGSNAPSRSLSPVGAALLAGPYYRF